MAMYAVGFTLPFFYPEKEAFLAGKNILILGIGNTLMGDDGFGVKVASRLKEMELPENVEVVEGGTKSLDLLNYFEGKEYALIIDAVDLGKKPGELIILKDKELNTYFKTKFSVHEIGLDDLLNTAELLNILPRKLVLAGLQPKEIAVSTELSSEVKDNFNAFIETVFDLLDA